MSRILTAVLATMVLVPSARAQEKVYKTPEEAVQALADAAKKADVKAFVAVLTQPMQKMFAMMEEEAKLRKTLNAALEEKFGKDPREIQVRTFEDSLKSTTKVELIEKKEAGRHFLLKLRIGFKREGKESTQEERMLASKEGEGFKLSFVPPNYKEGDDLAAVMKKEMDREAERHANHKKAVEMTIKEIKEGKYKSRQEAQQAYFNRRFPPPEGPPRTSTAPTKPR